MFDAYTDLRVEMFAPSGRTLRQVTALRPNLPPLLVRTRGLVDHGHPELELASVAPALSQEAAMLLQAAADSAMSRRALQPGRIWAHRQEEGFVIATNVIRGVKALRLLDIDGAGAADEDAPAKTAICAMAVTRARLVAHDDAALAQAILGAALDWFPGEPGEGISVANDALCNQGNSLAHLLAADRAATEPERDARYRSALLRSRALIVHELGGPLPERAPLDVLRAAVASLVSALLDSAAPSIRTRDVPATPPGKCYILSPVLHLGAEGLVQTLAIGTRDARDRFFEEPVATRLRDDDVHALVAEVFERAARGNVVDVLARTRNVARAVYESGYHWGNIAPSRPFRWRNASAPHAPLLSRVLAAVAHDVASGKTWRETRSRFAFD